MQCLWPPYFWLRDPRRAHQAGCVCCWKNENSGEREQHILPNHLKRAKDTYKCFGMHSMPHSVAHHQILQMEVSWYLGNIANMSCSCCCCCQTQPVSTARRTHVYRDTIVGLVVTGGCPHLTQQMHHKTAGSCTMSLYGNCQQIKGLQPFDSIMVFGLFHSFINLLFLMSYWDPQFS